MNKRKHIITAVVLTLSVLFIVSCSDYARSDNGLRFKVLKRSGQQTLPKLGEVVECYYSITSDKDSVIYSNFGKTPERILFSQATHSGGDIMDALGMMSEGDSISFLINADSFYSKTKEEPLPSYVRKGSDLQFTIKMVRRMTQEQAEAVANQEKIARWNKEIADMQAYAERKHYDFQIDSATGMRYYFFKHADKPLIQEGNTVEFHCTGRLLNDVAFDDSYMLGKSRVFVVGREVVPPGLNNIFKKMREGERGVFILPFDLGFGAASIEGSIPAYSTLVYEVDVLKVKQ